MSRFLWMANPKCCFAGKRNVPDGTANTIVGAIRSFMNKKHSLWKICRPWIWRGCSDDRGTQRCISSPEVDRIQHGDIIWCQVGEWPHQLNGRGLFSFIHCTRTPEEDRMPLFWRQSGDTVLVSHRLFYYQLIECREPDISLVMTCLMSLHKGQSSEVCLTRDLCITVWLPCDSTVRPH